MRVRQPVFLLFDKKRLMGKHNGLSKKRKGLVRVYGDRKEIFDKEVSG